MYEKEKDLTLLRRFARKIRLVPTMSSPILMTNEFFTSFMGAYLFPSTSSAPIHDQGLGTKGEGLGTWGRSPGVQKVTEG